MSQKEIQESLELLEKDWDVDPILHDLSLSPREMSAAEIVEYWLGN